MSSIQALSQTEGDSYHGTGTNVTAQVQGIGEGGIGFFNEVSGLLI
jgi:hypothetical protein